MRRRGAPRGGRGSVRIIAGSFKGRVLRYPAGNSLRPTMQRTKAAVFDSIGPRIRGATFVDLYCAAGGVGIEALSRGAGLVHFVDNDKGALAMLRANLERCRVDPGKYLVHPLDAVVFIERIGKDALEGALVYADPPYDSGHHARLLEILSSRGLYDLDMLLVEVFKEIPPWEGSGFSLVKCIEFGQSMVCFFVPEGR